MFGSVSLPRSRIYFSVLTLGFVQMSYNLAYSVLTPSTNGETGLQLAHGDPRILDAASDVPGMPSTHLFGIDVAGFNGFYLCAVTLILAYYLAMRITRSPFGMALRAIRSNQSRMKYTGLSTRPYPLQAFVDPGMKQEEHTSEL